ncbi:MAG TPA: hypothetical protein VF791_14725 [Pyrinomonadaceae bacterium]
MKKTNLVPRFIRCSTTVLMLSLIALSGRQAIVYGEDWRDQRCDEIQNRLDLLEGYAEQRGSDQPQVRSAPQIRKEIAEKEGELASLQSFQKLSETTQLSAIINNVPLVPIALIPKFPGTAPLLADILVRRGGDLLSDVNKREIRLRMTELPRLREEQTKVGQEIFLLRDESESLKCSDSRPGDGDYLLKIISGKWRAAETSGNLMEITRDGIGVLLEVDPTSALYGFRPGDNVLSDLKVVGDTLEASFTIRPLKEDCPMLGPLPVKAIIRFEPGNRTFTLTATRYPYCMGSCKWADNQSGTFVRTYSRVD